MQIPKVNVPAQIEKIKSISQEDLIKAINTCYDKTMQGLPGVKSSYELANEYLAKYRNPKTAAEKLINAQVKKCTTSGFVTGLGGLLTMAVAIPADLTACIFVQLQMISAIAVLGGYDPKDDEVRTVAYICLTGESVAEALNKMGVKISQKVGTKLIDKIPGTLLVKVNQKLGGRIITKFGSTGAINLCDFIPVVGGVIGGGFNYVTTRKIGKIATKEFLK